MSIDFESLGFSREELQQRVVDQLCELAWNGGDYTGETLQKAILLKVKEQINATVNALADQHVLPRVTELIEGMVLQETNGWGEKTGKPVTFIEYLVARAEAYMTEKVDSDGKGKGKADSQSSYWSGKQARMSYMIEKHLHYSIETAMKDALKIVNGSIATGIEKTVKMKLEEVLASLKVGVTSKS